MLTVGIPECESLPETCTVPIHTLQIALDVSQPGMRIEQLQPINVRHIDLNVPIVHLQLLVSGDPKHANIAIDTFDREVGIIGHLDAEVHRVL